MADLYTDTSSALAQRLQAFRRAHSAQTLQHQRTRWTYYAIGDPQAEALLLLHGGGADAEAMFPYIDRLARDFYVIAPNVPPHLRQLDEAIFGLRALLAYEKINRTSVVGLAFGAALAQMFIRRFTPMVLDLVISHSVIPSQHLLEYTNMQRALIAFYPAPLMNWFSRRAYRRMLAQSTTPAPVDTRAFWQAYFTEALQTRIGKRHTLARSRIMADYHRDNEFSAKDLNEWYSDMLLIPSRQDDVITEGDRGAIKGMYPRAFVQTLWGYDHLAPILAADELAQSIAKFLLKADLNAPA